MEYGKVKSVGKNVTARGAYLDSKILDTMARISDVVGGTLGPGGRPVLIERYEHDLPPFVTKDGVTVFRALGFEDSYEHCIMEAARDAAVKTGDEAGDGTTSCTILAESLVRLTYNYCQQNPKASPQKVARTLMNAYRTYIEPTVKEYSVTAGLDAEGKKRLFHVAKISANGDEQLAEAVLQCFDITGDQGNVNIVEATGPSGYHVEKVQGYPVLIGYEECCGKFYSKFINRPDTQKCVMEDVVFLLYHGAINEPQLLLPILNKAHEQWEMSAQGAEGIFNRHNIVVIATAFSEQVIGWLAANFEHSQTLNIYPMVIPRTPQLNGTMLTLEDLAALTGAVILDPLNDNLDTATVNDLGGWRGIPKGKGLRFEASRWKSVVYGMVDEDAVIERVNDLEVLVGTAESTIDKILFQERLARVSGGIAKLTVMGSSNSEIKERKDRADDAVCAVKGAIKHGCLPGGGWTLLMLSEHFRNSDDPVLSQILAPALFEPVHRLLTNAGYVDDEIDYILGKVKDGWEAGVVSVFDVLNGRHVDPWDEGVLDSTPAVLDAIRNSMSIASVLGTLGGLVVFRRDHELERKQADSVRDFVRETVEVNK